MSKLKHLLSQRVGQFVPRGRYPSTFVWESWSQKQSEATIRAIPNNQDCYPEYRDFMWRHFYAEAPIPIALKMASNREAFQDLVQRELLLFLYSGSSFEVRSTEDGTLLGLALIAIWSQDSAYSALDVPALAWHNTAAEIAQERRPNCPQVVWRDLQFQHLYDISQLAMRKYKRDYTFWLGQMYLDAKLRRANLGMSLIQSVLTEVSGPKRLVGTQSNFRAFDKQVMTLFPDVVLWDEVKYKDETLRIDGQPAFQAIEHCDGIRFFFGL